MKIFISSKMFITVNLLDCVLSFNIIIMMMIISSFTDFLFDKTFARDKGRFFLQSYYMALKAISLVYELFS